MSLSGRITKSLSPDCYIWVLGDATLYYFPSLDCVQVEMDKEVIGMHINGAYSGYELYEWAALFLLRTDIDELI
jgi:hypothetical protein